MKTIHPNFSIRLLNCKSLWIFFIVSIVLLFTARWSLGIWDSPEFALAGTNFQLTHAPGAPFYVIILNTLQSILFFIESYKAAVILSVLCSSIMSVYVFKTALLLYNYYTKKVNQQESWLYATLAVAIGCFNLSMWELSYEVEVYSMSGMFLSLVFFKIFQYNSNLITRNTFVKVVSIIIFMSLGVHKLNLLILLPVFYILIRKAEYKNIVRYRTVGLLLSILAMATMVVFHSLFLKSVVVVALFFQDALSMSQNLAFPFFGILLILITFLLWYYKRAVSMTILTASLLSYLLYLPFLNSLPEIGGYHITNTASLINHINASQFGLEKSPLLLGKKYDQKIDITTGKKITNDNKTWFPRMHSTKYYDVTEYPKWDDASIRNNHNGTHFLWSYQVYSLYLRYLGTNFIGRSNVHKNSGTHINHSISSYLYNTNSLKDYYQVGNIDYFGIPLFFILLGILYSFKNIDIGIILGITFLITGTAIILYLNPPPSSLRIRERDYISFFSFIICGIYAMLGIIALSNFLPKGKNVFAIGAGILSLLFVVQNYQVQNKSQENFNEVFSSWILESIPDKSIVLANGDNLTFPYWYQLSTNNKSIFWVNIELLQLESYRAQLYNYISVKNSTSNLSLKDSIFSNTQEVNIINEIVPDLSKESPSIKTQLLSLVNNNYELFLQSNWALENKIYEQKALAVPYLKIDDKEQNLKKLALNLLSLKASQIKGMNSQEMNIFIDFYVKKANYLTTQLINNGQKDLAHRLAENIYLFYEKFDLPKDGNTFNTALRLFDLNDKTRAKNMMEDCIKQNERLIIWMVENKNPMNKQITLEQAEMKVNLLDQMLVNYNKINASYIQTNLNDIQQINKDYLDWKNSILNDI